MSVNAPRVNAKKKTNLPSHYLIFPNTPLPKAKQYVQSKRCECGCYVVLDDKELLCPVCGLVREDTGLMDNLVYGGQGLEHFYQGKGYTRDEKAFMKYKNINSLKPRDFGKEQTELDYKYFVDVVKQDLCLFDVDIQNVFNTVMACGGLKNLHSRLDYKSILLAVCRYTLKERGVTGYLLNLNNNIYREYNLKSRDCYIIEENIRKYRGIYRCST